MVFDGKKIYWILFLSSGVLIPNASLSIQYIPRIIHKACNSLCFLVVWQQSFLLKFFGIASQALGQSYDCPSASEAILKNMDIWITLISREWWYKHKKTKQMCAYSMRYTSLWARYFWYDDNAGCVILWIIFDIFVSTYCPSTRVLTPETGHIDCH